MTDYTQMFRLDGRRALVIGAGGIGREAARALAAHGASVTCADKDPQVATATAAAAGEGATGIELDVTDHASLTRTADALGPVDVLVLTAATNVRKRILDYSPEEFDRVVGLNLAGSFAVLRAFGGPMVARGSGSVITFSSIRGTVVEPGQSVYAATKAGLVQLVRTAAAEWGPSGVRVNAIAPGVVETPLTAQIKDNPEWYDAYAAKSALGRWSSPSELAGAVVYLASDASTFVTGSVLAVDGGWTAVDGRFTPPA
ncbi:SDR family NAD(P)-dependent oxidoreductase [Pseudonocardia sp. KRD291]|uniref:SDR family NAD(P)-dependent oxidoreductase n=1 Tax=Pseudonocardia sp. KRD291 TaxID=2792007 RepID=UPI001C4A0E81|nr:SDR family oxidoreductase [Pseudonocardia sp. KRD291]MBW0106321.1 SDR family oxidoreductase [Pseudonocardia sp. KRD291]